MITFTEINLIVQTLILFLTACITVFLWRKDKQIKQKENVLLILMSIDQIEKEIENLKEIFSPVQSLNVYSFYFTSDVDTSIWKEKRSFLVNKLENHEFKIVDDFFKKAGNIAETQKMIKENFVYANKKMDEFRIETYLKESKRQQDELDKTVENEIVNFGIISEKSFDFLSKATVETYIPNYLTNKIKEELNSLQLVSSTTSYSKIKKISE